MLEPTKTSNTPKGGCGNLPKGGCGNTPKGGWAKSKKVRISYKKLNEHLTKQEKRWRSIIFGKCKVYTPDEIRAYEKEREFIDENAKQTRH